MQKGEKDISIDCGGEDSSHDTENKTKGPKKPSSCERIMQTRKQAKKRDYKRMTVEQKNYIIGKCFENIIITVEELIEDFKEQFGNESSESTISKIRGKVLFNTRCYKKYIEENEQKKPEMTTMLSLCRAIEQCLENSEDKQLWDRYHSLLIKATQHFIANKGN